MITKLQPIRPGSPAKDRPQACRDGVASDLDFTRIEPVLRSAGVGDGAALANLYREVHTPPSGGNAEDHYPFPQYLNGAWIDQQIAGRAVYWIVAENHGEPIGTGGIIRIGEQADQAIEFRGFVVKPRYRRQGVATRIVRALLDRFGGSAAAMFAETRMTESGALKTFRKFGLLPIGLEPYAHKMSHGLESMVQLASVASRSMGLRAIEGCCTPAVRRLARVVLGPMGGRPLRAANPQRQGTVRPEEDDAILETVHDDRWPQGGGLSAAGGLAGDSHGGMDSDEPMPEMVDGVLSLQHRQGRDLSGNRYIRKAVVLRSESMTVARSMFVYDQCDHRAQVSLLAVTSAQFYGRAVAATLRSIGSAARGEHFSAFADVRADALDVQACLESAGFVPTVYFPAMIAAGVRRQDIVQYTYLHKLPLTAALGPSTTLNWPDVERVIGLIIHNREVGSPRALPVRDRHLGIRPVSQILGSVILSNAIRQRRLIHLRRPGEMDGAPRHDPRPRGSISPDNPGKSRT
jgi:GNAT superfamily N-acetyltransferase